MVLLDYLGSVEETYVVIIADILHRAIYREVMVKMVFLVILDQLDQL